MVLRPPRASRTYTRFPYAPLFRSRARRAGAGGVLGRVGVEQAARAGELQGSREHGRAPADPVDTHVRAAHLAVERLDLLPGQSAERDVAEALASFEASVRHPLARPSHGDRRARRQLDHSDLDGLLIELEHCVDGPGLRAADGQTVLVDATRSLASVTSASSRVT